MDTIESDFVKAWSEAEARDIERMAPNPSGIKANYEVDFQKANGRTVTFHRSEVDQESAVSAAQRGYQWTYGAWPGEPLAVREVAS